MKLRYIELFEMISRKKLNMLNLSKNSGIQYNHIINMLKQFELEGIIKKIFDTDSDQRDHLVELTKKGQTYRKLLSTIKAISNDTREYSNKVEEEIFKSILNLTEIK